MAYADLIANISDRIESELANISVKYNFDFGDEFEIGICQLLSKILPDKYGICRGFVVTGSGEFAGDDIIIYDKATFPTIRLLDKGRFDKKEQIPIEAVYAYIEAKHTLFLSDKQSGQSLMKACEQVSNVKKLPREKRQLSSIDPYVSLGTGFNFTSPPLWPDHTNPMFGGIISRFIKTDAKSQEIPSHEVFNQLQNSGLSETTPSPDFVVLGKENMAFPGITIGNVQQYGSPFFIEGVSTLVHKTTVNSSLATGIIMLLFALDIIKLNKMPYKEIIAALIIPNKSSKIAEI